MGPMRIIHGASAAIEAFAGRGLELAGELEAAVDEILERVRSDGDVALIELTEQYDGVRLDGVTVAPEALEQAESELQDDLKQAIDLAIQRVRDYYRQQPSQGFLQQVDGSLLGQLVRPLERVACYAPGGTAPLFSSLIMCAVPAMVAGVPSVVAASPPQADGNVAAATRYVCYRLGIERLYRIGGAQAIAALAYGTESVARVDKIVGPGNRYVIAAKRRVYGVVGIEALPGPTETLVLADGEASLDHVTADLLAQAEHDGAHPILVTDSRELIAALPAALEAALSTLPTEASARSSISARGIVVSVNSLDEGIEVANAYAPEHLCLLVQRPWELLPKVRHAGGVFLGDHSLEALGDYLAGPSHVMPTGGSARYASFVNVRDFQRVVPVLGLAPELVAEVGPAAARMARAEGLEAHARAIEARLDRDFE